MPQVTANGIRINYEERGRGEPLLLLMGLGAPGGLWAEHVAEYEKHFRCLLMDNRGAGESDRPAGPYTTAQMAEDARDLLDALGLERVRVAGISMGSGIAQELALRHPQRVSRLVLISSWARCNQYAREIFEHFARMRAVATPAEFTQLLQLWIFAPGRFDTHFAELTEARAKAGEKPMPQAAFAAQCSACITHDTLDRLGELTQPCLLTVGEVDIFTPPAFSHAMHERLPNSRLELFPGWGHCHHWEDLERFNRLTAEFLKAK